MQRNRPLPLRQFVGTRAMRDGSRRVRQFACDLADGLQHLLEDVRDHFRGRRLVPAPWAHVALTRIQPDLAVLQISFAYHVKFTAAPGGSED